MFFGDLAFPLGYKIVMQNKTICNIFAFCKMPHSCNGLKYYNDFIY